jgi:hypothetical protein
VLDVLLVLREVALNEGYTVGANQVLQDAVARIDEYVGLRPEARPPGIRGYRREVGGCGVKVVVPSAGDGFGLLLAEGLERTSTTRKQGLCLHGGEPHISFDETACDKEAVALLGGHGDEHGRDLRQGSLGKELQSERGPQRLLVKLSRLIVHRMVEEQLGFDEERIGIPGLAHRPSRVKAIR